MEDKKDEDNVDMVACYYCHKTVPKKDTWGFKNVRACKTCAKDPVTSAKKMLGINKEVDEEQIASTGKEIKGSKSKLRRMKKIAKMFGYSKAQVAEAEKKMGIREDDE